jgi:hypothetical protein
MSENLSPIGFWSYARQDDEEKLSGLRSILQRQLQQKYGREPIKIFQDVAAIPPGADWNQKISEALNSSTFLIPIITPNFLESEWCNQEVFIFLERERAIARQFPELARAKRIFPIDYIDISDVETFNPQLLPELRKRQWTRFRDLRYKDSKDEDVLVRLDQIAESICKEVLRLDQRTIKERRNAAVVSQPSADQAFSQKQVPEEASKTGFETLDEDLSGSKRPFSWKGWPAAGGALLCALLLGGALYKGAIGHETPSTKAPSNPNQTAPAPSAVVSHENKITDVPGSIFKTGSAVPNAAVPFQPGSQTHGSEPAPNPVAISKTKAVSSQAAPKRQPDPSLKEPLCSYGKVLICSDYTSHVTSALVCVNSILHNSDFSNLEINGHDAECSPYDDGSILTKADICNSSSYACGYNSGAGGQVATITRDGKSYSLDGVHGKFQYFADFTTIDSISVLKSTIRSWIESKPADQGKGFDTEYREGKRAGSDAYKPSD